eukprot:SAG11_NODE_426_length_9563_cov_7.501479_13_plen_93_part_01
MEIVNVIARWRSWTISTFVLRMTTKSGRKNQQKSTLCRRVTATFEWKLKAMRRQDSTLMKLPPARRWSSDELVSSLIYTVLPLAILLLCLPSF